VDRRPEVAVTIYAPDDRPEQIHGLQLHGQCIPAPDRSAALEVYLARFEAAREPPYRQALEKQTLYRIRPTWLRWIDNRRGFGWSVEITPGV